MLTPVQTTASPVGLFATSGSYGQLLVKLTVSPGRFVAAAHAVQKKNAESCRALPASTSVPAGMANATRPSRKTDA